LDLASRISVIAFEKITNNIIMTRLFTATGFLFVFGFAVGQARDGTAELQQTAKFQSAALIYLPYSPEVVEKALSRYLSQTDFTNQKNEKGYVLSSNTILVKNNKSEADMHFLIGLKSNANPNESAIYLKLNSSYYKDNVQIDDQFNMQDAKDYLDNLAVAIKPYASKLQLELQQKNLSTAQEKNANLITKGNKLEEKSKKIQAKVGENKNHKINKGLARRKAKNDKLIGENLIARLNSNTDISRQKAALALLSN